MSVVAGQAGVFHAHFEFKDSDFVASVRLASKRRSVNVKSELGVASLPTNLLSLCFYVELHLKVYLDHINSS